MSTDASRDPVLDLVLATVGRTQELNRFLTSLEAQSFQGFRVLIVDQNLDDRLDAVLASHGSISMLRLTSLPGLSRARNVALAHVEAGLVAFPDDDCWYPPDLLERMVVAFADDPTCDGISGRSLGSDGRPSNMRWDRAAGPIDPHNIWRRVISYTIFLRRPVVDAVGPFDEKLGAGSGTRWGSGEEIDYVLRALETGFTLNFDPSFHVQHDDPQAGSTEEAAAKAHRYGLGQGRVLRTHRYPWWFAAYRVAYLIAGAALFFARRRSAEGRFYLAMARGRATGWLRPGT